MRKKTSVAFLAVLGLLLFGCSKKTTKENTTTKTPTPVTTTAKPTTKKEEKKFTVTVNSDNQSAGTIEGVGQAVEGSNVTLTAKPNQGYTFLGFYDGANKVSDGNSTTYTISNISKDVTLTAKWAVQSFTLTVTSINEDDIDVEAGTVSYEDMDVAGKLWETNTVITLTATPFEGYQFNGWYLAGATDPLSTDAVYDFHMLGQNVQLQAVFGVKKCTIEVVANDPAAMEDYFIWNSSDDDTFYNQSITVDYNVDVQIGADASNGYNYAALYIWNEEGIYDPADMLDVDYSFTATDSVKFYAVFEPEWYDLFINNNDSDAGDITVVYGDDTWTNTNCNMAYNTSATLTAVAKNGYTFVGWYSGDDYADEHLITDEATYTFKMIYTGENWSDWTQEEWIFAKFVGNDVQINFEVATVDGEGNPLGTINKESGAYTYNSAIELKATPSIGYSFDGWYEKVIDEETLEEEYVLLSSDSVWELKVDFLAEKTIYAKFAQIVYMGDGYINIDGLDATYYDLVCDQTDQEFVYGQELTLVAPTIPGYTFVGWYNTDYSSTESEDLEVEYLMNTNSTYTFNWNLTESSCITACYARQLIKLNYNTNGGDDTSVEFVKVKFGIKTTLEVPTRYGYAFQYWDYADENGVRHQLTNSNGEMLEPLALLQETTIRAKWLDGKVIASFNTDGGTVIDDVEVTFNHTITRPADPEKTGYTFVNWYDADGVLWSFSQAIVQNTTLYAHWTINSYEVTIQSQDDSIVDVNSEVGGEYDYNYELVLNAEIHEGYTFLGWFENDGDEPLSSELSFTYYIPAYEATVEARFEINYYTIELRSWPNYTHLINYITNPNDYVSLSLSEEGTSFAYGTEITVTATLIDGTYVYGWSTDVYKASREYYYSGGSRYTGKTFTFVVPAKDVKIWLDWGTSSKRLTVTKNVSEGDAPYYEYRPTTTASWSTKQYKNTTVTWYYLVKLFATEIEGYTFEGWYDGSTLLTNELTYEFRMPYEVLNYQAKYTPNNYTLTLIKNVEDQIDDTENISLISQNSYAYHQEIEDEIDAIEGYEFLGWYFSGTDNLFTDALLFNYEMPHEDITLEARFMINEYEIKFGYGISNTDWNLDAGEVEGYYNECYYYGNYQTTLEFEATTYNGWTFKGYYLAAAETTFDRSNLSSYTLLSNDPEYTYIIASSDVTIFAVWTANQYNLVYYTTGTTTNAGKKVTMGDSFELDVPELAGQDFVGWYYVDDDLNKIYLTDEDGISLDYYSVPSALNIQSQWGVHLWTVTFETGYNASTSYSTDTKQFTQKVENNSFALEPDTPVRRGYTFLGWFNQAEGGTEWNFSTPITTDTIIYAHWSVNSYTLTISNYYGIRGIVNYSSDDYDGTLVNTGTTNIVTSTSITVKYGETISIDIYTYIGRNKTSVYKRANGGTWYSIYSNKTDSSFSFDYVMDYDSNALIQIEMYANDEMKYYTFESTQTTCKITGLDTAGKSATSLVVPKYVTEINLGAFAEAASLKSITLPFTGTSRDGDAKLGYRAFGLIFGTTSRTNYTARTPYYVNSSDVHTALADRYIPSSLTTVIITDETEIAASALEGYRLSSITINSGVTKIGAYAFATNQLMNVTNLPNTITRIEKYAFKDATHNTSAGTINIPNSVTYLGRGVFANTNYHHLVVPFIGSSSTASGEEALLSWFYRDSSTSISYCVSITQNYSASGKVEDYIYATIESVTINPASGVTPKISYGAFMNVKSLATITSPAIGQTLNDYAFYGCTSLNNIVGVLDNTLVFRPYAFYGCTALTSMSFTDYSSSVRLQFMQYSFAGCTALTECEFNRDIWSFEGHCFDGCANLATLTFNDTTSDHVLMLLPYAFNNCPKLTSFDVNSQGVDKIPEYAFYGCTQLSTFNCRVVEGNIGQYAFANTAIDSWTIPMTGSNITVGQYAFAYNASLEIVEFPDTVSSFGQYMFARCWSLSIVEMPFVGKDATGGGLTTSDKSIQYSWLYYFDTFAYGNARKCDWEASYYYIPKNVDLTLTKVKNIWAYNFYDTYEGFNSITISGTIDTNYQIGRSAFAWCYAQVNLKSGLTTIADNAFYRNKLKSLVLPNGVTTIGANAFTYSISLSNYTITIPNTVTSIGASAFSESSGIVKVILGSNVTSIGANAFYKCNGAFALQFNGTSTVFASRMASFATDWNKLSDTLYIKACKCTDVDYSWS